MPEQPRRTGFLTIDSINNGLRAFATSLVATVAELNPDLHNRFELLALSTEVLQTLADDIGHPIVDRLHRHVAAVIREQEPPGA